MLDRSNEFICQGLSIINRMSAVICVMVIRQTYEKERIINYLHSAHRIILVNKSRAIN